MKIVNLTTFLALPKNTLFSKYGPCVFGALEIKGDTLSHDFLVQSIASAIDCKSSDEIVDILDHSEKTGASVKLDFECESRDGMFDPNELFAVWEPSDVAQLIERLKRCTGAID